MDWEQNDLRTSSRRSMATSHRRPAGGFDDTLPIPLADKEGSCAQNEGESLWANAR